MRLAVCFSFLVLVGGNAQLHAATADGGCVPNTNIVSPERATQFLENPPALLDQFKEGQGGLASAIRDLITVRPEAVEGIVSLARASSADQSRAIGAGLGTAASVCVLTQPKVAQLIAEAVLNTQNRALIDSYAAITGDISTEAINGAEANGDTTSGGGRGSSSTDRPTAATATDVPFLTQAAAGTSTSTSTPTLFTAATTAATPTLTSVSPSN